MCCEAPKATRLYSYLFSKDGHSGRPLRGRGMTAPTDGTMVMNQQMETEVRYNELSEEDIGGSQRG